MIEPRPGAPDRFESLGNRFRAGRAIMIDGARHELLQEADRYRVATLAAIDISITRELEIYQAAEISLLQIRETIDPNAKLAHEMELQAQALQQAYHRTRGK